MMVSGKGKYFYLLSFFQHLSVPMTFLPVVTAKLISTLNQGVALKNPELPGSEAQITGEPFHSSSEFKAVVTGFWVELTLSCQQNLMMKKSVRNYFYYNENGL
jgi:hypothetical protein